MRRFASHSFLRYTGVGVASRGIQTLLLILLVERMGIHYVTSSLIAVAIVHMAAYAVNRFWTFKRAGE